MKRTRARGFIIGIVLILLVGFIAGAGGIVTSNERPPIGQAPPINATDTPAAEERVLTQSQSQSSSESTYTYVVTARGADAIDTAQLAKYGEVGTQVDARIELTMSSSSIGTVENISWVTNVRPVIRPEPAQTDTNTNVPGSSDGERGSLGVQQAHQNGITGEDVDVGIIDAGFDPDNQAIQSNVVDTRSFRSSTPSRQGRGHGTSVAEIVTQTAPDSQLSLVSAETGTDTEAAIDYLERRDVDIIVHSAGLAALEDDGNHIFTDDINTATESGTLFVNSAGNEAQVHWEGDFRDTNENDTHEWTASGDELNCLPNCKTEYSGDVTVYVRWSDQGQASHYRPSLFNPDTNEYIKIDSDGIFSTQRGARGTTYAKLTVEDIQSQSVSLVIDHVSGPANDEIEVIVDGPQEIERNISRSSIQAPADVEEALAIAAYERERSRLAPYSSRGPTDDRRTGIDVTGYTNIKVTNQYDEDGIFAGTSAAAPYVGGVAALVEESQPGDQSPTELTDTLKSSSDDILNTGTDTASGSGVINAVDAVNVAETPENSSENNPSTTTNITTTATIQLDSAPDGLQRYNISVEGPSRSSISITTVEPGVISNNFQIRSGGEGDSIVTARGVDIGENVDSSSEPITLYEVTFEGTVNQSEITVAVTDLTNDDGDRISDDLLTTTVQQPSTTSNPFPDGIPGVSSDPPTDPDDDGKFEDINGDGERTFDDAIALAFRISTVSESSDTESFDFNGDGEITFADAIDLAFPG